MKTATRSIGIGFLLAALVVAGLIFAKPYLPENIQRFMQSDAATQTHTDDDYEALQKQYDDAQTKIKDLEEQVAAKESDSNNDDADQDNNQSDNDDQANDDQSNDDQNTPTTVNFVIPEGASASQVASDLASQGVISDATAFSNFLTENGYDVLVRPGTFELNSDMTNEQIAQAITN
ncbi:MAG: endolytic transglycosylase MltG [Bavariicoccus seileri]|uniref:Endolytic transglycosylase MltG n=1 Tax=Bavariicoccus seileri TaxID=549685 RepID=A0A3D4S5D8_9ENTE|nr:endolytic transglycosylase MltG [Bavariicoccus seileri]HCS93171.1 hypothetical protein [Bavariicoccus seileri]